jgi:PD-(D/E)XK endonuclease
MLTTNQKGAVAEMAVAHEALKLGIGVYVPIGDERCDLIFDLRPRLVRVQCKWASRRGDVVVLPLYSARRTATGLRRSYYSAEEVDAFAAWCPDTGRCYYAEMAEIASRQVLYLRLRLARNNQAKGVHWARDYEFGAKLGGLLGP